MPPLREAGHGAIAVDLPSAHSAALLPGRSQDGPLLASGVSTADRIGITIEPAGGAARPTTTPVVVMALAA